MTLTAYQELNKGITQSITLPNIAAGSVFTYIWTGPTTAGNLFAYDYDDEWGNTRSGYTNPACIATASLCSDVGNFSVTFTAMWNGKPIFSQFSPANNVTGGFLAGRA